MKTDPRIIRRIAESIPLFTKTKSYSFLNNIYRFLDDQILKLSYKMTSSPFFPCKSTDPLKLNIQYEKALLDWLAQFPNEQRLGFLACALSVAYITEEEFDIFFDCAVEAFSREFSENPVGVKYEPGIPKAEKSNVVVYQISKFGSFDKYTKKFGIEGTRNHDKHPMRGASFDDLFARLIKEFYAALDLGVTPGYGEIASEDLKKDIHALLNKRVLLIEDYSFSGTSICNTIDDIFTLFEYVFKPLKQFMPKGYDLPRFYIILGFATKNASQKIAHRFSGIAQSLGSKYIKPPFIGYSFNELYKATKTIPESIEKLGLLLRSEKINLHKIIRNASIFFLENYFNNYFSETKILDKTGKKPEDFLFGFGNQGWTIITWRNSPNNTLPLLWYPTVNARISTHAIFPRDESRISHVSRNHEIDQISEKLRNEQSTLSTVASFIFS